MLLTKLKDWGTSVNYSHTTVEMWLGGLGLILVLAFLWSTVVRDLVREVASEV